MIWRLRQHRIEIGECFRGPSKHGEDRASIEQSVATCGIARENGIVAGECFLLPAERAQRISPIELRIEISRPPRGPHS